MTPTPLSGRRPLKSRDMKIFRDFSAWLAKIGAAPNAISFCTMIFGALAGASFAATSHTLGGAQSACWLSAAVFMQLRLIANLLDGMVAVEGGRGGPVGDLWNEAPDRVADAAILIGAGFAAGSDPLHGFGAAIVAVFVAYCRALGASVGAGQIFIGPMAKQHRMALLTGLTVVMAILPYFAPIASFHLPLYTLALLILGCIVTALRRLSRIAAFLRAR